MVLDEEALANEQNKLQPQPEMPVVEAQPREWADPESLENRQSAVPPPDLDKRAAPSPVDKKMFDKLLEQALVFLTSEKSADRIIARAKINDPAEVLAESVQMVVDGVMQAAGASGVEIPPQVRDDAMKMVVAVMAALMEKAGLAQDAKQLGLDVLDIISNPQPEEMTDGGPA